MNGLTNLTKGIEGSLNTLQPKNTDSHEEKVIQNCITNPYPYSALSAFILALTVNS